MSDLLKLLKKRFDPAHAGDLDATIEFNWPSGCCRVAIHSGEADYFEGTSSPVEPELVIYFSDEHQAIDIMSGRGNPIKAFMRSEFRSNGHIVWVFQTLAAFSKQTELPGLVPD